jgi:gamma-glutamyltranspeptidase / glutathione hydrolase
MVARLRPTRWLWSNINAIVILCWGLATTSPSTPTTNPIAASKSPAESPVTARVAPQVQVQVPHQPQQESDETAATTRNSASQDGSPLGRFRGRAGPRAIPGKAGMVVTVDAQATHVGVAVLQAGGNAIDAAVAVTFALAVTHPSAGNLGGGGFWLIHKHPSRIYALDFRETAPRHFDPARFESMENSGGRGPNSVAVPGTVAGLFEAHRRFGSLPWNRLLEAAISLARLGHQVSVGEAAALRKLWSQIGQNDALRAQFALPNHRPPKAGTRIKRPALARTLETIRDAGRDGFYRGAIADSVLQALGVNGLITAADLAEYQPRWRTPREFRYRDFLIRTMPLPSAGGVALTEGLTFLNQRSLAGMTWGSAQHLHLLLEAQRRADHDRLLFATDPDRLSVAELQWHEMRYLDTRTWDQHPIDPNHATTELGPAVPERPHESDNTTHFSVVDSDRNIVSATVTLSSPFGSMVATTTGLILNNALASFSLTGENQAHPGQRTTSSMSPTLVYDSTGPVLVLGSPGGDTIPSTLMQIVSNVIDFQMSLTAAVDAPRVHQSYMPDRGSFETRRPIGMSVRQQLKAMGHRMVHRGNKQGDAKCILLTNEAAWGYSDPREGGLAEAPVSPVHVSAEH